jgi:hydroxymethylbilane synthase
MTDRTRIVIGTRKSRLALAQTELVAAEIRKAAPRVAVELFPVVTQGDIKLDKPLPLIGGKGLFTQELEQALLSGRIDLAVHSAKDLPTENPPGLDILCVPPRAPAADVLVTAAGITFYDLPLSARIGTSSLRRQLQMAALRPGLRFADIRGNVDTRVNKVLAGQYDAVVLAQAGLIRAGMSDASGLIRLGQARARYSILSVDQVLPAPGQACLAIQGRADDDWLRSTLVPVNDSAAAACLHAERQMLQALQLDCHMPFAALCQPRSGGFAMQLWLADPLTGRSLRLETSAPTADALVAAMVQRIDQAGGRQLLEGCLRRKA